MMESVKAFLPEIFLSFAALVLLMIDVIAGRRLKFWVILFSIASLFATLLLVMNAPMEGRAFGLMVMDSFAAFFKILALISAILVILMSEKDHYLMEGQHSGSYTSLILLSIVGVMFLASTEDLLMTFIGLELTTLPLFILAGFHRNELRSSEGAIKFFLVGAFSTGLTIYGISLLYGLCGSTHFNAVSQWFASTPNSKDHLVFALGILFLLVGLAFKLTLVPFHQWTPDTYEGAPTPITAFFQVSREAGVIVIVLRFFGHFVNISDAGLIQFFAVLSVLTMTVGNITALKQNNLKRLLAYSSVAHAGTLFVGVVSANQLGREGVMLYSVAYSLMSLGAFAVVVAVERIKGTDEIVAFQGLAKENFTLALLMAFFLLSLGGIPPTLGFWGKFYVFASAVQSKMYWLVGIGLLNSVIAVYYYFRIAHKMFFQEPLNAAAQNQSASFSIQIVTAVSACAILILGIFPQEILAWIQSTAHLLP